MLPGSPAKTAGGLAARGYRLFLNGCGMTAGLAIVVLSILITVDVVIRNLGWGNFPWLLEVSEYTIYISTFLAAPWVLHLGAHVRVDLLLTGAPAPVSKLLELTSSIVGIVISGFLVYHGMRVVIEAHDLNAVVVKHLAVSEWALMVVIPLSGCLLALEFMARGLRVVRGKNPVDPRAAEL